jgi:hypothetical protein
VEAVAPSYKGVPLSGGDHQSLRVVVSPVPAQLPRDRGEGTARCRCLSPRDANRFSTWNEVTGLPTSA